MKRLPQFVVAHGPDQCASPSWAEILRAQACSNRDPLSDRNAWWVHRERTSALSPLKLSVEASDNKRVGLEQANVREDSRAQAEKRHAAQ